MSKTYRFKDNSSEVLKRARAAGEKCLDTLLQETVNIARPNSPIKTGNLRRSISYKVDKSFGSLHGRTFTECGYGAVHELGTKHMAARPFLKPALMKASKLINDPKRWKL